MLKASKKNRVLRIPDEKAKEYLALGYTITDMKGKVVSEPENAEKKAKELAAENAKLQAEVETLKAEIAKLQAKPAKKTAAKTE